ncbi:hypothetical protein VNI00_005942 [Paramarasmius palmivorus]|uniref:F-box domain-containing protein n=1 Tax=Paramarasmius palmivorus TaxID=297713 RepID=A0AAW0DD45_9AGAR
MSNIEEQLQLLDEKIAQTKENLRNLHFQRNSLLPICRLPNEILGLILTFCASDVRRHRTHCSQMSWLWPTHVCQHWRTIALGCPAMWDTPDFSKPSLAREMLVRSKSAPLHIRAATRGYRMGQQEVLSDALRDIARVAAIEIDTSLPLILNVLLGVVQPAPVLEKLRIHKERVTASVVLPDNFLAGNAPRLREMSLRNCVLHWGRMSKTLSGLRSLCLYGDDGAISNVFPDGDPIVLNTVTLSKLEHVRVVGSVNGCISLLNCIASPSATSIEFTNIVSQPGDCNKALTVLPHLISITQSYTESCSIYAMEGQFGIEMFDQDLLHRGKSRFRFDLVKRSADSVPASQFYDLSKRLLELLSSLRVTGIHLVLGDEFSVEDVTRYFGSLKELATISVEDHCAYAFIQAFYSSTFTHPSDDVPFSSLNTIVLERMDFGRSLDAGTGSAGGKDGGPKLLPFLE